MTIEELQQQIADLNDRVQSLGERFGKELNDGFNNSPPIGSIIFMASTEPPSDQYLLCDGRALSRTEFRELFSVISTTWGEGDGTTTKSHLTLSPLAIGAGRGSVRDIE